MQRAWIFKTMFEIGYNSQVRWFKTKFSFSDKVEKVFLTGVLTTVFDKSLLCNIFVISNKHEMWVAFWPQGIVRLVYLENVLIVYCNCYLENSSWFLTVNFHAQEKQLYSSMLTVNNSIVFYILHFETSRINFRFELEVLNLSYESSAWELYPISETTHLTSQKYPLNIPCGPRSIWFVNEAAIWRKE